VLDRLVVLEPESWTEHRDRALVWDALGDAERAIADMETYLAHADDALDIDAMAERLATWRRQQR
jgi:regulator of sirC expression with transglutaminase-like and TPR domain